MIDRARRALVLCAHTDDEFGCAGTIARLLDGGSEVHYVALSRCEESVPAGFPSDVLERECRACTAALGIDPGRVHVGRYPVRHFPAHRQEILEEFVRMRRELSPDLVLVPASFDTHQDHHTVYEEGFRAFKHATILGYELPQNLISFQHSAFVALDEPTLKRKVDALQRYESQGFRTYSGEDFIRGLALVRGVQCGAPLAEAFEVVRLVVR
ncbi:MAG TPA: PIG-L deacetylase family protein [Longimicrobium sp.]|jgi:LmbE family N-acetylglucosaminyl deacetylase